MPVLCAGMRRTQNECCSRNARLYWDKQGIPAAVVGHQGKVINNIRTVLTTSGWLAGMQVRIANGTIHRAVRQYRPLITNSWTLSRLVGTQDIGPHELSQCVIHVPILSPLPIYTVPIFHFQL